METQKLLLKQINLLEISPPMKLRLAEMVTELYSKAWTDGYDSAYVEMEDN